MQYRKSAFIVWNCSISFLKSILKWYVSVQFFLYLELFLFFSFLSASMLRLCRELFSAFLARHWLALLTVVMSWLKKRLIKITTHILHLAFNTMKKAWPLFLSQINVYATHPTNVTETRVCCTKSSHPELPMTHKSFT